MVRFSEIQQFPYFPEPFPGNFRTIGLRFENFEMFGRMVNAYWLCTCVLNLRTFLTRHLQNNNVK